MKKEELKENILITAAAVVFASIFSSLGVMSGLICLTNLSTKAVLVYGLFSFLTACFFMTLKAIEIARRENPKYPELRVKELRSGQQIVYYEQRPKKAIRTQRAERLAAKAYDIAL